MRAIWKGSIAFGLINIPISLFAATRTEELKFRLLRSGDLSPVNYKRVAEADGKEVPWDQIVKGYEYEKGKFVVLKEEDFKRVDIASTQTVDIVDFVALEEINPMFFHKPYYIEPVKSGAKAYALLRDTLAEENKVGIAKVVIKTRQYLAAVKPVEDALLLELMHFADELVQPDTLQLPRGMEVRKAEKDMAKQLIHQMTDKWEPEKYKDEYRDTVMKLIEEKAAHPDAKPKASPKARKETKVIDLAEVLRRSLAETTKKSRAKREPAVKLKKAA